MLIEKLVKTYPSYTHDDVFNLEYEFAMMLLMIAKDEADFAHRYNTLARQQQKNGNKNRK